MDYTNYSSAGKWYEDALKEGYRPSCAMMGGISQTMKKLNMKFPEAFRYLEKHKKITLVGNLYVFDLSYSDLLNIR